MLAYSGLWARLSIRGLKYVIEPWCASQSETSGVEVEYVSAPREYEELLQSKEEPEPSDNGFAGVGGLGFVSAGASGAGLGSEGELLFVCICFPATSMHVALCKAIDLVEGRDIAFQRNLTKQGISQY